MLRRMGFSGPAPVRDQILTVATLNGSAQILGRSHPKARVWLLEDRSLVVCLPDRTAPGRVRRESLGEVAQAVWNERTKILLATLSGGGTVTVNARGCGCGMGAVGSAGPTESKHFDVVRVRQPDWYVLA